jgi:hypothetical protein
MHNVSEFICDIHSQNIVEWSNTLLTGNNTHGKGKGKAIPVQA